MADQAHDPNLERLELLWESDPSSKVYLELAEAYREAGKHEDAVRVLETSLQHRPRDPRGRVALARCRLDLGEPDIAASLLEDVTRQDPAHVLANKLLLESYLRTGDGAKAQERLNIYRLLNDRDPELDHLEYRLEALRSNNAVAPVIEQASDEPAAAEKTPTEMVAAIAAEAASGTGNEEVVFESADAPTIDASVELESADSPAFELAPVEPSPGLPGDLETTEATSPMRGDLDLTAPTAVVEVDDASANEEVPEELAARVIADEPTIELPPAEEVSNDEGTSGLMEESAIFEMVDDKATSVSEEAAELSQEADPEEFDADEEPTAESVAWTDPPAAAEEIAAAEMPVVEEPAEIAASAAGDIFDLGAPAPAPSLDALFDLGASTSPAPSLDGLWGLPEAAAEEPLIEEPAPAEAEEAPAESIFDLSPTPPESVLPEAGFDVGDPPELVAPTLEAIASEEPSFEDVAEASPTEMTAEQSAAADSSEVEMAADMAAPVQEEARPEPQAFVSTPEAVEIAEPETAEPEESVSEAADEEAPTAEDLTAAPDLELPPELEAHDDEPVASEPEVEEGEPAATVTMGELYLNQGHREEAEKIFRRVLEEDPENSAALAAIHQLESMPEPEGLMAVEEVAAAEVAEPEVAEPEIAVAEAAEPEIAVVETDLASADFEPTPEPMPLAEPDGVSEVAVEPVLEAAAIAYEEPGLEEPALEEPVPEEPVFEDAAVALEEATPEPELIEPAVDEPEASPPELSEPSPAEIPVAAAGAISGSLSAGALLADRALSGVAPEGLTAKKILVLNQYMKHLRTAARNHVR